MYNKVVAESVEADIKITDRKKFLNEFARNELKLLIREWMVKKGKHFDANRVDLVVSEVLRSAKKVKIYEGGIEVVLKSGKSAFADIKGEELRGAVVEGLGEVESQLLKRKSRILNEKRKRGKE